LSGQLQTRDQPAAAVSVPIERRDSRIARLGVWWQRNRAVIVPALAVFIAFRVALSLVAVLAAVHLPEQQGLHPTYDRSSNIWLDVWARWDSQYYLDIARKGYGAYSSLHAFFPFYPLLISTVAPVFGHDYVLSGMVVSSVAFCVALVYLFKLVALEYERDMAGRTILYLAVYPTALFFLAVYTESVFLAATVAAMYYARRGLWWSAGLAALLAGFTRANAVALVLALAYEAWRQNAEGGTGIWTGVRRFRPAQLWAVAASGLALVAWGLYLGWLTHDPLAYVHRQGQGPFARSTEAPWNTLLTAIQTLGHTDLSTLDRAVNTTDLAFTIVLLEACVAAWWVLPRVYAVYLSAATIFLLSSVEVAYPLQSMPRYSVVLFPLFMVLAHLGRNRNWDRIILLVSAPLLGLFTALFATWYWIF
jgi:hypothetical protein